MKEFILKFNEQLKHTGNNDKATLDYIISHPETELFCDICRSLDDVAVNKQILTKDELGKAKEVEYNDLTLKTLALKIINLLDIIKGVDLESLYKMIWANKHASLSKDVREHSNYSWSDHDIPMVNFKNVIFKEINSLIKTIDIQEVIKFPDVEYSIVRGVSKVKELNPLFNVNRITVGIEQAHTVDNIYGVGFLRREIPKLFAIEGKLKYRFVNVNNEEVNSD